MVGEQAGVEVKKSKLAQSATGAPNIVFSSQSLAEKVLKKKNYISLEIGIRKTIEWARALAKL